MADQGLGRKSKVSLTLSLGALIVFGFQNCGGEFAVQPISNSDSNSQATAEQEQPLTENPVIQNFKASAEKIEKGEPVTLSWGAEKFNRLTLLPGNHDVTGLAEFLIEALDQTTTFTLVAENALGSSKKIFQVKINGDDPVPVEIQITNFSSDVPNPLVYRQSFILQWALEGAEVDKISLSFRDPISGALKEESLSKTAKTFYSASYCPLEILKGKRTFKLNVIGVDGSTASKEVEVECQQDDEPAVITEFESTTLSVSKDEEVEVSWAASKFVYLELARSGTSPDSHLGVVYPVTKLKKIKFKVTESQVVQLFAYNKVGDVVQKLITIEVKDD